MTKKLTLAETIQKVYSSASSIFTKEDVLNLLQDISYAETTIEEVTDALYSVIERLNFYDFVDHDSIDFYLDGREVCLQGIEFNTYDMSDMIVNDLQQELSTSKEVDSDSNEEADEFSGEDEEEIQPESKSGCGDECQCKKKKKKAKKH